MKIRRMIRIRICYSIHLSSAKVAFFYLEQVDIIALMPYPGLKCERRTGRSHAQRGLENRVHIFIRELPFLIDVH